MLSWLKKTQSDCRATFLIEGMHCGRCVERVSAALQGVPGVQVERVDVGSATATWNSSQAAEESLLAALAAAGFPARREETE